MSSNLRVDTSVDYEQDEFDPEQRRQRLLAQRAEMDRQRAQLDAELASLQPSTSQSSYQHHHRSPIYKQSQQRRSSNVPRSMSSNGVTAMSRHLSSERNDMSQRPRALSQRSATSMGRSKSRGNPPQRVNVPFTQNGAIPPPLNSDPHPQNHAIMEWVSQEQPLTAYTFSHQTPQLQQTMSQRSGLEQVPELHSVGENPADFILRTMGNDLSPTISIPSSATINNHRLSTSSYNMPSTPTSDSLTTATTLTGDMSRQNSLCNGIESMMKFNSNNSFSADLNNDQYMYDHVASFSSSRISRPSDEEQSQLLVGTGASHESQFSNSFQFPSSNSFGEKMEKSQSVESTSSSTSSASSRNVKRLQDQIAAGQSRPLMPKGGSDGISMSRDNSSQAMTRIESKDGSQDKVAISKPSYQRPKHDRVCCKLCDNHPDGFRGEHELRRHVDREHKEMVKKWVCIEPTDGGNHPVPIVPLSRCKACSQQKKKYGAYYNAAAHLRRAHFNPKTKGRSKSQQKVEPAGKRGGKGGGDEPPMTELKKYWMKEVEVRADFTTDAQQEAADESEEEILDNSLDDQLYSQPDMSTITNNTFNTTYLADTNPAIVDYSTNIAINNSEIYDMPSMSLDFPDSKQQVYMDQTMYTLSNQNISLFSSDMFQNDPMAFANAGSSQSYDNLDWNLSSHC
ncbi:hypothetical protein ONS95_005786 [Cadophora gregata]|uniref:uncharacterized protein n=1 Tax=Cadophora gregata TaxID=51156 RepID=UPI0026DD11E0|nr:uncharacterized protein ONS95_005786 [Cadophora gregata]KAK0103784.1 hypothetical protein ONS95_005786 [Cadophora gregata]